MPKRSIFLCLSLFLLSLNAYSQKTKIFTGTVTDSINNPLESVYVLARPSNKKATLKYAITDNKGRYRLKLNKSYDYQISVSYLGYTSQKINVEANSQRLEYHFKLKSSENQLDEIVITKKYEPVQVKKDTLIYDVDAFSSGNERKMKEVLEKLPGVEVDKNGIVTVQGKKVTQMLVEGRSFFGGNSKLAVENIPADALDKIEVIKNYSEVGFLKNVSDSDEMAMNVKLKEDKKKFVFGDIEVAGGNQKFYQLHSDLFYYSPNLNLSYIGDLNNIGKSVLTYGDLIRFQGGVSRYIKDHKGLSNLRKYTRDRKDVKRNKSQFSAVNYGFNLTDKLYISGFGLFSKIFTQNLTKTEIEYLTNQNTTFEKRNLKQSDHNLLATFNIKLDYSKSETEKWYYNAQIESTNNDNSSNLESFTNIENSKLKTLRNADNISFKQYIEWHKEYNQHHKTSFVVNHIYENQKPKYQLLSDKGFLTSFIPLEQADFYNVKQIEHFKNNTVDALFKHYWILNSKNHIYTSIGNNFSQTNLKTSDFQKLTDGETNDFSSANFGNDLTYKLNDAFFGLEYKFKIKKLTTKASVFLHFYNLKTTQFYTNNSLSRTFLEPAWESKYKFSDSENLKFNYALKNEFPRANQVDESNKIRGYNSVFKGNALLKNERFHTASLYYTKMNTYSGLNLFTYLTFNKKTKNIRNKIVFKNINRFTTPVLTDDPQTNWNFIGNVQKKIYRFRVGLNSQLSWFKYEQSINRIISKNERSFEKVGIDFRTTYKKWPSIHLSYHKAFNQFKGLTTTKLQTDSYEASIDYEFLPSWVIKAEYNYTKEKNVTQQKINDYNFANFSIDYHKKNSPWGFNLSANNLLRNKTKINNSISDILISERTTYLMPRVFLFALRYKL